MTKTVLMRSNRCTVPNAYAIPPSVPLDWEPRVWKLRCWAIAATRTKLTAGRTMRDRWKCEYGMKLAGIWEQKDDRDYSE